MSSTQKSIGDDSSTSALMLDLHEIQATVLRTWPAPPGGVERDD
jgi:hypothetical protein